MLPPFKNRREAGRLLARELQRRGSGKEAGDRRRLVLALPRGGVPVGFEVAAGLDAPLDLFLVRKLGVPGHPELAMGALASGGVRVLNGAVVGRLAIPHEVVEEVTRTEMQELVRREKELRGSIPPLDPAGKSVVLVDDGLATGASMRAAVEALRMTGPAGLTIAVPTAPSETARGLRGLTGNVVCLVEAESFVAVGQWYEDFSQTGDEEVRRLLKLSRSGPQEPLGI